MLDHEKLRLHAIREKYWLETIKDKVNDIITFIFGITFCVAGLIHGTFKYFVIRDAARDAFNSGGVPVMDFVIFVPLWLAVGASNLLKHGNLYPFPFFGLLFYIVLAIVLCGVMALEYRLGKPEKERQLLEIEKRRVAEQDAAAVADKRLI